jgi:hypothetical protein
VSGQKKHSRKRKRTRDQTDWVRHNGKLCPPFPPGMEVPPPPAYPAGDPLWPAFAAFVAAGGVVRKDLLTATDGRDEDWRLVWAVFLAGSGRTS